jgi:formylglycine-generating enzyme required for sulfatase activity
MVIVPGGNYDLGPNSGWARPARRVSLEPFALDRREVTNRQYAAFVDAQPATARRELLPRGWTLAGDGQARYLEGRGDHPVVYVDWDQAAAYATWAGKRLPTEDEWEAAAAGPEGLAFPWGNSFVFGVSNGAALSDDTMPVESFPQHPSPSGAFDMAGNVWEWTSTLEDGSQLRKPPEGAVNVVIRGGGFDAKREQLATRFRWTAPGQAAFAHPTFDRPIGFRCAMDL